MTDRRATPPARRAFGWGALALGLVAVVAMAAHGAAWSTQREAAPRSLPHAVVDAGLTVAIVAGLLLVLASLAATRSRESPEQRRRRWATAISFIVAIALISILRLAFGSIHHDASAHAKATVAGSGTSAAAGDRTGHPTRDTWWPVILVGLGTVALFVSTTARRRGATTEPADPDAETVALLDASLDDLRTEPDPRRAVTAAYARMERRLSVRGFARRPSETPTEYLHRALGTPTPEATIGVGPLAELTELAELARFSATPIDEAMRARAIAALERLRAELRSPDAHHGAPA